MEYASDYGADFDCAINVTFPGGDLDVERGYLLNIKYEESAPATWVLSIIDEDGTYCPDRKWLDEEQTEINPWYGVLNQQAFDWADAISYHRLVNVTITHGGETLTFAGPPTHRAHRATWPDGKVRTTWSGADQSHILYRDGQSMAPIRSSTQALTIIRPDGPHVVAAPGVTYSTTAMAQVCTQYGLGFNAGDVPTNIPVPEQQRVKEKPIKWITDLLGVPVSEWTMDGGSTLRCYTPNTDSPTITGTLDLSEDWIEEVEDEASEVGLAWNRIVATRAMQVASIIQGTPVACIEYKQYEVAFGEVVMFPKWQIVNAFNGVFSDFEGWKDGSSVAYAQRRIAGYTPPGYSEPIDVIDHSSTGNWNEVDTIKFTWGPPITYSTAQQTTVTKGNAVFGFIRFIGQDPTLRTFGAQTLWEYSDPPAPDENGPGITMYQDNQGKYVVAVGGLPVGSPQETLIDAHNLAGSLVGDHPKILEGDPYVPNDTWLETKAKRTRKRMMRDAVRTTLKLRGLRLGIKVGQFWTYRNPRLGIDRTMYVHSVEHNISAEWGQRYTRVSLCKYPDA